MHKIPKSTLPTEEHVHSFHRLINEHIAEMRLHDRHMKMVAKDPKNYHPYPPPQAHPDVANAIFKDGNDYNVAFEVEDDTPQPPPVPVETLEQKKARLADAVARSAAAAFERILPNLKARLFNLQVAELVQKINENAIETSQLLTKEDKTPADEKREKELKTIKVALEKELSGPQAIMKAREAVSKKMAIAENEIHDLTEENIAAWRAPEFED